MSTAITPTGLSGLNAARLAAEERRHERDLAPILHHRETDGTVRVKQRNLFHAMTRNAIVRLNVSNYCKNYLTRRFSGVVLSKVRRLCDWRDLRA